MRRTLMFVGLASACLTVSPAFADHCQPTAPVDERGTGQRLTLGVESAGYRNSRYDGVFEGATLGWSWAWDRWALRAQLPSYRLNRNGLVSAGLGDVFVEARARIGMSDDEALRWGLSTAATLPSGNASADLGMGHAMLFGGVWLASTLAELELQARLSYAGAVGAGGAHAHHGGGSSPIVSPMNSSEVTAALVASYALGPSLRLRASSYLALPVAVDDGKARAVAGLGVGFVEKWFDSSLEGQAPFVGDPFTAKLVTTLGASF